jgi:hypothetical protein
MLPTIKFLGIFATLTLLILVIAQCIEAAPSSYTLRHLGNNGLARRQRYHHGAGGYQRNSNVDQSAQESPVPANTQDVSSTQQGGGAVNQEEDSSNQDDSSNQENDSSNQEDDSSNQEDDSSAQNDSSAVDSTNNQQDSSTDQSGSSAQQNGQQDSQTQQVPPPQQSNPSNDNGSAASSSNSTPDQGGSSNDQSAPTTPPAQSTSTTTGVSPVHGIATFFGDSQTLCRGNSRLPDGQYGVALNGAIGMSTTNSNDPYCGKCIKVTGPNGSLCPVVVVDVCDPSNCDYHTASHIDILDYNNGNSVYSKIGNPSDGVVDVTWEFLPSCDPPACQ